MTIEWLAILLFVVILMAASAIEIAWLVRKEWAATSRAAFYVITTNVLGLAVSALIIFVLGMIILMMVFGPSGEGGTSPEWAYWAVLGGGVAAAISFLFFIKRAFLRLFNIRHGKAAWIYAIAVAILISISVAIPPTALVAYSLWK